MFLTKRQIIHHPIFAITNDNTLKAYRLSLPLSIYLYIYIYIYIYIYTCIHETLQDGIVNFYRHKELRTKIKIIIACAAKELLVNTDLGKKFLSPTALLRHAASLMGTKSHQHSNGDTKWNQMTWGCFLDGDTYGFFT